MSDTETVIIAYLNGDIRRAFYEWDRAREWRDAVAENDRHYTLIEVMVEE